MKKRLLVFTLILSAFYSASAQTDVVKYKVAIFAPLYLDSAYNEEGDYRFSKNAFPKYINPGLEFYEGAQLAIDSLRKEKAPLEIFIYDTKSATTSISQTLNKPELSDVGLIIVHCNSAEAKLFAEAGLRKNIPVINANMPNDASTGDNPFFIVLNPTLRTQCEGLYKHVQKFYSLNPIIVFRKKGQLEDRIKQYFEDYSKSTMAVPLAMKYVDLPDSFTLNQLRTHLDTINQTVCLAGSLDENFGKRLVTQLAVLHKQDYQSTIIGMPTWDGMAFTKKEFQGPEIVYGNPFYNSKTDKVSKGITDYFNKVMFARPSDMVFRGYEVTWKYTKLLMQYGKDFPSNLANKQFKLFTDFDVQPVLNKQTMSLDYFENKKLYFLKWQDGLLKAIN
jgi:hypothetical protein